PALRQVLRAALALVAPDGHVEVVRLVDPLSARAVLLPRVDRNPQLADRGAARRVAQLGVAREVPHEDDAVDVRHALTLLPRTRLQSEERTPRPRRQAPPRAGAAAAAVSPCGA